MKSPTPPTTDVPASGLWQGALLATIVTVAWLAGPVYVYYEENDDAAMASILAGYEGLPGAPEVPFISRTLNHVLVALYRMAPAPAWYGIVLSGCLWLGLTLCFSFVVRRGRRGGLLLAPAALTMLGYCAARMSFTSTTLVCQFGVFLYLLDWLRSDRRLPLRGVLLTVALLASALWRIDLFVFTLAFGAPLVLWGRWSDARRLLPGAACVALFIAGDLGWKAASHTRVDREFSEYSALRSRFHDTAAGWPHPQRFDAALAAADWSVDDFVFFQSWNLHDDARFNAQTLKAFLDENAGDKSRFSWGSLRDTAKLYGALGTPFLMQLFLGWVAIAAVRRPGDVTAPGAMRRKLTTVGITLVPALVLFFYRCPLRILVPTSFLLLSEAAVLFLTNGVAWPWDGGSPRRMAASLVASACWLASAWIGWTESQELVNNGRLAAGLVERVDGDLAAARETFSEHVLLLPLDSSTGVGHGWRHPWQGRPAWAPLAVVPSGWAAQSPRFYRCLQTRGLERGSDLLAAAARGDVVLFTLVSTITQGIGVENPIFWEWYLDHKHRSQIAASGERLRMESVLDRVRPVDLGPPVGPDVAGLVFFQMARAPDSPDAVAPAALAPAAAVTPERAAGQP